MSVNGGPTDWADIPGARFAFEAERTPEAVERDGTARTLSSEAMSEMFSQIGAFVLSRMLRAMNRGQAPHVVGVHVYVELDDEAAE